MTLIRTTIACLALGACTTVANPPSLAPRANETRASETLLTTPSPMPVQATRKIDAAFAAKLSTLMSEVHAGDDDFNKTATSGAPALRAGQAASPGSEAWVAAELVRSALEIARQRSATALAQIDTLAIAQAEILKPADDPASLIELQTAQAEAEAIVARQTAKLASFSN